MPGEKKKIGAIAERAWEEGKKAGTLKPALSRKNCDVDDDLLPSAPPAPRPRLSDWVLGSLVFGEVALMMYARLRSRVNRLKT